MVTRLPLDYLADVRPRWIPSRSPEVVAAMPPETVAAVGTELAARREWVVMGAFVSYVSASALRATVQRLSGEQLLRIGFVLDDLVGSARSATRSARSNSTRCCGRGEHESLWRELDDLLGKLDEERAGRLAARYAAGPFARPEAIDAAAERGELTRPRGARRAVTVAARGRAERSRRVGAPRQPRPARSVRRRRRCRPARSTNRCCRGPRSSRCRRWRWSSTATPARDDLLALAAASHDGEDVHVDGARAILAAAGLDEDALQCPLGPAVRAGCAARLGRSRQRAGPGVPQLLGQARGDARDLRRVRLADGVVPRSVPSVATGDPRSAVLPRR